MNIIISSLNRADAKIRKYNPDALVSIGAPGGGYHCTETCKEMLTLEMWDTTPLHRGKREGMPRVNDVRMIIRFAHSLRSSDLVLFHCMAGRSRSTAAALIVLATRGSPESMAVDTLLAAAPKSTPNGWLLALADSMLGTKLFIECTNRGILKW